MSTRPGFSRVILFHDEQSQASLGLSMAKVKAAATDNPTVVKASPGVLHTINITNHDTTPHFLKLYDKATAPSAADTPAFTLRLGGSTAGDAQAFDFGPHGLKFATGIAYRITAAVAENDNTALVADDVTGVIGYR